jgi:hypothetical protein
VRGTTIASVSIASAPLGTALTRRRREAAWYAYRVTAYARSGLQLVKRRRVLVAAEGRLRAAIQRAAVVDRDVERVRNGHLAYLKALRYELQTGTDIDGASQARIAKADEADRAWRAAAAAEIVTAYSSGAAIAPGEVSASFAAQQPRVPERS